MTISERIFHLLDNSKMTQKDFSEKTGIAQSTISDWRKKNTNPSSDKIMIICKVLDVTPYYLLSGIETTVSRSEVAYKFIDLQSEEGLLIETYQSLDAKSKAKLLGYMDALKEQV